MNRFLLAATVLLPLAAHAQGETSWQACAAIGNSADRLACFDRWAEGQKAAVPASAPAAPAAPPAAALAAPVPSDAPVRSVEGGRIGMRLTTLDGCRDTRNSELTRFWELAPAADCGTFGLRGFRPISIGVATADTVNEQPTSGNPANNATTSTDYRTTEARLQLSVRTKVAQGLLVDKPEERDSLWVAYSQQSYWQIFTPRLSRPFRSTDHEPEVLYVAPLQSAQAGQWRLRVGGVGLVHQSNGQSLPFSRSWNRVYLLAGAEKGAMQVQARVWNRLDEDADSDDNPGISDYIGRLEVRGAWQSSQKNLWAVTARHSLKRQARGSLRLEWFRDIGKESALPGGLQLHTQLFTGYGDSLLDYNRRRTMFSIGFSLVDW